jgi:hypothetical protein
MTEGRGRRAEFYGPLLIYTYIQYKRFMDALCSKAGAIGKRGGGEAG